MTDEKTRLAATPEQDHTAFAVARPEADQPNREQRILLRRRWLVLTLNVATVLSFLAAMGMLMRHGGITPVEIAMLVAYSLTLPWLALGFWNGILGFLLQWFCRDPASYVTPQLKRARPSAPIKTRTAIVMALRNEDADRSLARFEQIQLSLARTGWGDHFDFHVLSDSTNPEIKEREEAGVATWQARSPMARIFYRCRTENKGYKAGNIAEFLERCHEDYDYFLPLDADSLMGAPAILRLVRVMEASPEIGILQGLVVGTPSKTLFTRAFQFGMRHGMRAFTLGSAWWQGDCAPFWGHNALIRATAFHTHCQLPVLPGKGPLGGYIMSHDQVEAAMMRRAGYEVRSLAEEDESFEDNPPSMPDFVKRELRWCNGNMQYFKLLNMPGLKPVSRVQFLSAISMYIAAPAWLAFMLIGAGLAGGTDQISAVPLSAGLTLFAIIMTFNLMPKLMGLAQVLSSDTESARYGGRTRVVLGGLAETFMGMLIGPAVAVAVTIFLIGMLFGTRIRWDGQQRDLARLGWDEATRALWPQTLAGLALGTYLAVTAPWALIFASPVLISLGLSIPIAVLNTLPVLGELSRRLGLFDIPEDRQGDDSTTGSIIKTTV